MAVVILSNFKTFAEWSKSGYKINKGARATWIDNVAMFAEQQVTESGFQAQRPRQSSPGSYGNHWKGCTPKGTSPSWGYGDDEYEDSPDAYGFDYH